MSFSYVPAFMHRRIRGRGARAIVSPPTLSFIPGEPIKIFKQIAWFFAFTEGLHTGVLTNFPSNFAKSLCYASLVQFPA